MKKNEYIHDWKSLDIKKSKTVKKAFIKEWKERKNIDCVKLKTNPWKTKEAT